MLHLPAEIATEIVSAWISFVKQKPESQASAVPGGNAGTPDVPRMPCCASSQEPGPPSESVGALIAAIGAVAKLLKAEIREDPEAQKAMDTEFYKLQGDGTTGTWDLSQVRAKRDVMQEARRTGEKTHYGRVFGIASIKGSELPIGHKDRTTDDPVRRATKTTQQHYFRTVDQVRLLLKHQRLWMGTG